jgi:hypothetical protein
LARKTTSRKKRRLPAFLQLGIVVFIAGAVIGSFSFNILGSGQGTDNTDDLGTLQLVGKVQGEEALREIEQLHGLGIEMEDAYVVRYVRGNEKGTVWVGITSGRAAAADLTDRMRVAIEDGNEAFGEVQAVTVAGQDIYSVKGPGGDHFFYQSQRSAEEVVWLQTNAAEWLAFVRDAVREY